MLSQVDRGEVGGDATADFSMAAVEPYPGRSTWRPTSMGKKSQRHRGLAVGDSGLSDTHHKLRKGTLRAQDRQSAVPGQDFDLSF